MKLSSDESQCQLHHERGQRVIEVCGELDLATRGRLVDECRAGGCNDVVLDLAATTFLDCGGFGGIIAARQVLEERGGSLVIRSAQGQPARLLTLLGSNVPWGRPNI